jgi:hypothetical protein
VTYDPMTPLEAEQLIRKVAGRLVKAIDEHANALRDEAEAKRNYNHAYLSAKVASYNEYGKKRAVGEHEAYAQAAAADESDAVLFAGASVKALKEEMHSLRQVLSSLQTNARAMQGVT